MPRYIDKDKLVNKLKEDCETLVKERWFDDYVQGYSSAIDDIIAEPTAEVQEVRHGKWEKRKECCCEYRCSVCEYELCRTTNYCPNCGAKMDGERGIDTNKG